MTSPAIAAITPAPTSVRRVMATVLLALLPGVIATAMFFGPGVLIRIVVAISIAFAFEAAMLALRGKPLARFLTDFSAPLAAVLFALFLPPLAPWWTMAVGIGVAIVIAKHCFGGLGYNLFNPAMAGVAVVRLCFPAVFALGAVGENRDSLPDLADSRGWPWIALLYLFGGIFLLWRKIIPWQTPVAFLAAVCLLTTAAQVVATNANPIAPTQLISALWMLGAFFIVTDPVTGCASPRGRLLFGAGVGAIAWLLPHDGDYANNLPFAVLLMNGVAPWLDRQLAPRRSDEGAVA